MLKNKSLTSLDLSVNLIGQLGAQALAELLTSRLFYKPTLIELNLANNTIDDEGISMISKAVAGNTVLQYLNLSQNKITLKGLNELNKCLAANFTLISLEVSTNSEKISTQLNSAIARNKIYLDLTKIFSVLKNEENKKLQFLEITNKHLQERDLIKILEKLLENANKINFTKLTLTDNEIGEEAAKFLVKILKANNEIRTLILNNNHITTSVIKILEPTLLMTKIQFLHFCDNEIDQSGIDVVEKIFEINTQIQELNIKNNKGVKTDVTKLIRGSKDPELARLEEEPTNQSVINILEYLQNIKDIEAETKLIAETGRDDQLDLIERKVHKYKQLADKLADDLETKSTPDNYPFFLQSAKNQFRSNVASLSSYPLTMSITNKEGTEGYLCLERNHPLPELTTSHLSKLSTALSLVFDTNAVKFTHKADKVLVKTANKVAMDSVRQLLQDTGFKLSDTSTLQNFRQRIGAFF